MSALVCIARLSVIHLASGEVARQYSRSIPFERGGASSPAVGAENERRLHALLREQLVDVQEGHGVRLDDVTIGGFIEPKPKPERTMGAREAARCERRAVRRTTQ